jgi:hypothetical protein
MLRVINEIRRRAVVSMFVVPMFAGIALGVSGCTTAERQMAAEEGSLNFNLVALSVAPDLSEVKPLLALWGDGSFTAASVNAGGGYTYLDVATEVPKKILSRGTWTATEVVRWTPAEGGATYGAINPGVVDLRVNLTPENGPPIEGALLRINCNIGFGGITNNDPDTGAPLAEGYWLTVPAGVTFGGTAGVGQFAPMDPIIGVTVINS